LPRPTCDPRRLIYTLREYPNTEDFVYLRRMDRNPSEYDPYALEVRPRLMGRGQGAGGGHRGRQREEVYGRTCRPAAMAWYGIGSGAVPVRKATWRQPRTTAKRRSRSRPSVCGMFRTRKRRQAGTRGCCCAAARTSRLSIDQPPAPGRKLGIRFAARCVLVCSLLSAAPRCCRTAHRWCPSRPSTSATSTPCRCEASRTTWMAPRPTLPVSGPEAARNGGRGDGKLETAGVGPRKW
jgi:hypothetical protein